MQLHLLKDSEDEGDKKEYWFWQYEIIFFYPKQDFGSRPPQIAFTWAIQTVNKQ